PTSSRSPPPRRPRPRPPRPAEATLTPARPVNNDDAGVTDRFRICDVGRGFTRARHARSIRYPALTRVTPPPLHRVVSGGKRLKLMKYRRLVATVGLVGAGAMALLTAPPLAHQQNGDPDPANQPVPTSPPRRHDATLAH